MFNHDLLIGPVEYDGDHVFLRVLTAKGSITQPNGRWCGTGTNMNWAIESAKKCRAHYIKDHTPCVGTVKEFDAIVRWYRRIGPRVMRSVLGSLKFAVTEEADSIERTIKALEKEGLG